MQRGLRPLACRYLAPETLDQRRDILAPLAQWRQHHRPGGQRGQQRSVEASIGGKIGELLAARADQDRTVLLELRQEKARALSAPPASSRRSRCTESSPSRASSSSCSGFGGKPGATAAMRRTAFRERCSARAAMSWPAPGSPTMQDRPCCAQQLLDRPLGFDHGCAGAQRGERYAPRALADGRSSAPASPS